MTIKLYRYSKPDHSDMQAAAQLVPIWQYINCPPWDSVNSWLVGKDEETVNFIGLLEQRGGNQAELQFWASGDVSDYLKAIEKLAFEKFAYTKVMARIRAEYRECFISLNWEVAGCAIADMLHGSEVVDRLLVEKLHPDLEEALNARTECLRDSGLGSDSGGLSTRSGTTDDAGPDRKLDDSTGASTDIFAGTFADKRGSKLLRWCAYAAAKCRELVGDRRRKTEG